MYFVARAREYPVCTVIICFALGAATALLGASCAGAFRGAEQLIERPAPPALPVEKPMVVPVAVAKPHQVDLIVVQAGTFSGVSSDFSEFLAGEVRKIPEVDKVSEGVADVADMVHRNGTREQALFLGWKADSLGYEGLELLSGRKLRDGDTHKVILGKTLAKRLDKNVGDKLVFGAAEANEANEANAYEVVGIFKSTMPFEGGAAIIPFKNAQSLSGKRVTGLTVRVKTISLDRKAEIEAVQKQIEALRDPAEPTTRLRADEP